jgi:hypothetical protein
MGLVYLIVLIPGMATYSFVNGRVAQPFAMANNLC